VKVRWDEALKVDVKSGSQRGEKRNVFAAASGMEDVVENGTNEQNAKGVEESNSSGQHNGGDDLKPVSAGVMEQSPPSLHCFFPGSGSIGHDCQIIPLF
jgi:hypothetical protein